VCLAWLRASSLLAQKLESCLPPCRGFHQPVHPLASLPLECQQESFLEAFLESFRQQHAVFLGSWKLMAAANHLELMVPRKQRAVCWAPVHAEQLSGAPALQTLLLVWTVF